MAESTPGISRRLLLGLTVRGAAVAGAGALAAGLVLHARGDEDLVWQLDPNACIACGKCATECVLEVSAVKCVHAYAVCGYCRLCSGYFQAGAPQLDSGAEHQLCPVGAIRRRAVPDDDPYYEYVIDEPLCIACGRCVRGCRAYGNGSLFLQVRHDRCVNCNQCRIALHCPSQAFRRVPRSAPYLLKEREHA